MVPAPYWPTSIQWGMWEICLWLLYFSFSGSQFRLGWPGSRGHLKKWSSWWYQTHDQSHDQSHDHGAGRWMCCQGLVGIKHLIMGLVGKCAAKILLYWFEILNASPTTGVTPFEVRWSAFIHITFFFPIIGTYCMTWWIQCSFQHKVRKQEEITCSEIVV